MTISKNSLFKNSLLTDEQRNKLASLSFIGGTGGGGTVNAYSEIITGDDINLTFIINHKLDTLEVISSVYDKDDNLVMTDMKILDKDNIAIIFDEPPILNETYTVVVI